MKSSRAFRKVTTLLEYVLFIKVATRGRAHAAGHDYGHKTLTGYCAIKRMGNYNYYHRDTLRAT